MSVGLLLLLLGCHATDTGGAGDSRDPGDTSDCNPEGYSLADAVGRVWDGEATACDIEMLGRWIEERKLPLASPWNEEVRLATSEDGLTFVDAGITIAQRIGVPEIVRDDTGKYYLYVVDGDHDRFLQVAEEKSDYLQTHGWVGVGALALYTSDDGRNFTPEPAFEVQGLARAMVVDPEITRLPDGRWRMVYVGVLIEDQFNMDTWNDDVQHDLYVATSDDLIHWEQEPDPILNGPYADPTMVCTTETHCILTSFGLDWATSEDGGWTWEFENRNDPEGFGPEFVTLPTGGYRLIFNNIITNAPLVSQFSADGEEWVTETMDMLPDQYGEAPSLTQDDDGLWLMYTHDYIEGEPPQ